MKWCVPFILFLIFSTPFEGGAEDVIKKGELLTLERCIEIALKMQPTIVAAINTVNVNESRVGQAKSNYYPQINWTSSYERINAASGSSSGSTSGFFGRTNEDFDHYSTGFTLSQTLYDFGKTPTQVKIQNLVLDASRSDFRNTTEQIILAVKQAYYGVVQTKYNVLVAEDTVKQTQQQLEQAKGFYEVGTKPKFDVTQAEVNLSSAKLNLIRNENAFKIAKVTLNNVMGIPDAPEYTLDETMTFVKYEITLEDALLNAYQNRPDLQSIVLKRQAAERSIDLAKTGYYPVLNGNAGYTWSGEEFPLDHGWNIGATVSFPLFSGFLTKYQVEEAKANLNVIKANEELLKQTIFLEVQEAYLTLRSAEDAIPTAKLRVEQAQENLEIANGRYAAGVGNPLEVTDAEVGLANARTSYIQALYVDKVAQASLEKAIGMR
ncbi:MAG TPA: TolC family protein [Thermodesulfovibrionales bacterium]|jgi:outer membrane protein|nr:TolC family protein [Thermodesulfovibrionales bacterium]